MIAYLKGTIAAIEEQSCIADVHGVGYRVEVSSQTREALTPGKEIKLLIFHHITENDQRLFGFITQKEIEACRNDPTQEQCRGECRAV